MREDATVIDARTAVEAAEADLAEIETYRVDGRERLKTARAEYKQLVKRVNIYAPRVVEGVKFLNKNHRGWSKSMWDTAVSFSALDEDTLIQYGVFPNPGDTKGEAVLASLWTTAVKIHGQKKPVTETLLLKRVGVS